MLDGRRLYMIIQGLDELIEHENEEITMCTLC